MNAPRTASTGLRLVGWLLAGGLLVAVALWLMARVEWVEEERHRPPSGAALSDPHYALRQWLSRLGVGLHTPPDVHTLPGRHDTLVLADPHWNATHQPEAPVQRWVQAGGHLVIYDNTLAEAPWPGAPLATANAAEYENRHQCAPLAEPEDVPPLYGQPMHWAACMYLPRVLLPTQPPAWGLKDHQGWRVARWPVGQGWVTVVGQASPSTGPYWIHDPDSVQLTQAAWWLHAGQRVWLLERQRSAPWFQTLWAQAAPGLILAALGVLAGLWRALPRPGPLQASPPPGRRSLASQVQGTAAFLLQHGPISLHQAQRQALERAVQQSLPPELARDPGRCWPTVARLTGQTHSALLAALTLPQQAQRLRPLHWLRALALLEATRRRLLAARAAGPLTLLPEPTEPHHAPDPRRP